jgi:PAS domain S-box-containing protein
MQDTGNTVLRGDPESELAIWSRFLGPLFALRRSVVYAIVISLVLLIAVTDKYVERNISLGVLYIFPIVIAAMAFRRGEMLVLVAVCSILREHYAPFSREPEVYHRLFYTALSYGVVGFFLIEIARNRRLLMLHYRELREQIERRQDAEAQLLALVESSPAAVITLDSNGRIELANSAAEQIFAVDKGALIGRSAGDFLPVLDDLARQHTKDVVYRATTSGLGKRSNGEPFQAYVWFSTLPAKDGDRLAAIIVDSSEDLRDFQEASLQSILRSTRVLVGSVSHEIRNLAAAIVMVHTNLGRIAGVSESEDYRALATLAQGLARLATVELQQASDTDLAGVSLPRLLEEFCIIIRPSLEAIEGRVALEIAPGVPLVLGDHQGLIQVLMNLSRNSIRAMQGRPEPVLTLRVSCDQQNVFLRVLDSGPGVENPDQVFQPFQPGADASGLGLFISRAIVRACQGELYLEPSAVGCSMVIKLKTYSPEEASAESNETEVQA